MDRSQFLLMALLATAISVAQLGCGGDTSGEYRTFAESQADGELSGDAKRGDARRGDVTSETTRDLKPADTAVVQDEVADSFRGSNIPIEPEMVPDEEGVRGDTDEPFAAESAEPVPATKTESANTAADTGPPRDPIATLPPSDAIASAGSKAPDLSGLTDPAATEQAAEPSDTPVPVRAIELLIPEKTFSPEGAEQALRVSFDDLDLLKVLNMEPVPEDAVSHFPKWLSRLDGERIRIRGFMYPTFQETGLPGFVLARDNEICCFGRNPKIYDLIEVSMRDGVTTDYIQGRPFDVDGVFHINPEADEEGLYQLYQIDDAIVADR